MDDKKELSPVVTKKPKMKKNRMRNLSSSFLAEDLPEMKNHLLNDVFLPALKDFIYDTATNGLGTMLGRGTVSKSKTGSGNYISYASYGSSKRPLATQNRHPSLMFDDPVFDTKADAERVLDELCFALDKYKTVTVSDMYDLCGYTAPFTCNKYGWESLNTARIERVSGGYVIRMPRALPIE